MIHQFYNLQRPLTAHDTRKCWVLAAASLAASVGSSIFGGISAAKAARKAAKERQYRSNQEKAWYDKAYNTDYMDTKAGQNLLRRAQEVQDEYVRKTDGAAATGGASDSAVAQAKESANKAMGDTIANIGAQDTARKQQVEDTHQANLSEMSKEREAAANQRAANVTTAAQGASNALMNAAGSLEGSVKPQSNSELSDADSAKRNAFVAQMLQEDPQSRLNKAVGTLNKLPDYPEETFDPKTYNVKEMEVAMRHRLNKSMY